MSYLERRPPTTNANTPLASNTATKGQLAGVVVTILKSLPKRSEQAIKTFITDTKLLLERSVKNVANGANRIGQDIKDKLQYARHNLVTFAHTPAATSSPTTLVHASGDKLTDADTALVNQKLKEADDALNRSISTQPTISVEPGQASAIQATPAKQSDAIGLKDGFTRDFVTDLPRAQYFWQSDSEEPTPILNHAAYAQGDESTKLELLELAKKEIKEITVKTGVDEATLLRASHQAHQGIFGILGSVLQESAASPLTLSREIRGINSDDVEDTLPAASKGQLMGGKTSNAFILSSDGAGGIKVVATSTKTNCNFFAVPGFEPFQLEPEKSSTTLKVEFVIPKNGSPLLTKASYDFNLDFAQQ